MRVLDNLSTGHLSNLKHLEGRLEFIEGDILDAATVATAIRGVDCIFHQAALASVTRSVEHPLDTHAACVTGTLNLLDQARRSGVRRLVYAASSSRYGDQPTSSKREFDYPLPFRPTAPPNWLAEQYCHAFSRHYGFETVSLRYFNVFGPRQDPDSPYSAVIPLFLYRRCSPGGSRPSTATAADRDDFTYVANVVHGQFAGGRPPRAYPAGCSTWPTAAAPTCWSLLAGLNGCWARTWSPIHAPPRVGDMRESLADITQAREALVMSRRSASKKGCGADRLLSHDRQEVGRRSGTRPGAIAPSRLSLAKLAVGELRSRPVT